MPSTKSKKPRSNATQPATQAIASRSSTGNQANDNRFQELYRTNEILAKQLLMANHKIVELEQLVNFVSMKEDILNTALTLERNNNLILMNSVILYDVMVKQLIQHQALQQVTTFSPESASSLSSQSETSLIIPHGFSLFRSQSAPDSMNNRNMTSTIFDDIKNASDGDISPLKLN